MTRTTQTQRGDGGCPICGKASARLYRPFCSRRCADVDLHRWLGEGYRIPTDEPPADGGAHSDTGEGDPD